MTLIGTIRLYKGLNQQFLEINNNNIICNLDNKSTCDTCPFYSDYNCHFKPVHINDYYENLNKLIASKPEEFL